MSQFQRLAFDASPRSRGVLAPFVWLGGVLATAVAVTVGAVLAVFTAAAVAVIALFAGTLVFFAGLAMRARRRAFARGRRADDVIEAHKVDGAWVAYGWEQPGRQG